MQIKFNCPKDFGTIVTEKASSRADYLLNDAVISRQAHNTIIDEMPQVGDEFVLPEDTSAFCTTLLPSGKSASMLYLYEKNTGRPVRLYCSSILASVGNLAPMIKKDSSYDERFFGKTISIDNEFYEEVPVFDEYGCIRAIRNHRVYEINIKD